MKKNSWANNRSWFFLAGLSVLLTFLTGLGGALPLRVLRKAFGRFVFVFVCLSGAVLLFSTGNPGLALVFLILGTLVGCFSEIEAHGTSLNGSVVLSLLFTLGVGAVAVSGWTAFFGVDVLAGFQNQISELLVQIKTINPKIEIEAQRVFLQTPSLAVIFLLSALFVSLLFEKRLAKPFGLSLPSNGLVLPKFHLPSGLIWFFTFALVAAFVELGSPILQSVGINLLNVVVFLYFVQGLAVAAAFFDTYRVGVIWRVAWFVLFVVQLFLFISLLGLLDFWVDFRSRLARKPGERKQELKP